MTTLVFDRWIIAGTPASDPYPCQCEKVDPDPPQWKVERARRTGDPTVFACDPYVSKKGKDVGQWVNRCSCWGDKPDGKPEGCCAHSPHNPRFRVILDGVVVAQTAPLPIAREAGWRAPHERAERPIIDADLDSYLALDEYAEALGMPRDTPGPSELGPYLRRWTHVELHCTCPTPWDHLVTRDQDGKLKAQRGVGHHCTDCHENFRNPNVAQAHRRTVLDPCRPPATVRDPEYGTPILRQRVEGPYVIWS